ncbi:cyclase family protein [Acetobacteraceae bacterium H6797]|nr:cyclase family protein [Acetobacteraceae bacterium H6797]
MRLIDLTMPIAPHFRWHPTLKVTGDIAKGDQFRVSRIEAACHGFSHVDAQAHILADAPTIESTPLDKVVGPCRVLNLRDAPDNQAIDAERLRAADPGGPEGEILLLSTGWDRRRDYNSREFWTESPWLTRDAAEYLATLKPKAIAFDFPQDFPIRLLLDKIEVPFDQHVTHDVLLRQGVTLIEYLVNTSAIPGPRTFLCAAPLLIPNADGAPARIYAIEEIG